jgi:hypothetical protein
MRRAGWQYRFQYTSSFSNFRKALKAHLNNDIVRTEIGNRKVAGGSEREWGSLETYSIFLLIDFVSSLSSHLAWRKGGNSRVRFCEMVIIQRATSKMLSLGEMVGSEARIHGSFSRSWRINNFFVRVMANRRSMFGAHVVSRRCAIQIRSLRNRLVLLNKAPNSDVGVSRLE